jgi:glycolate oxidase iron-sulfur subunit
MDSPRGRIYLMGEGLGGEPLSGSMVEHFDRCLGCMSCVTACPSGVRYDRLIADTRAQVERRHPVRAAGPRRAVAGMLTGCVQDAFFPHVNAATIRVLAAEGCDVVIPRGQGCCGALSVHNGREAEAQRFARRLIDEFDAAGVDHLVVNAAGCGSALKEYGDLLRDDPAYADRAAAFAAKVRDLSEILVDLGPRATRHPVDLTVAYHDACHLAHAQGVRAQPRALLHGIPGLRVREIADPEICCGSAGVWNVLNPVPAADLGRRKARNVLATGADVMVTANPGCLMQVAASVRRLDGRIALAHTAEVLDASIRGLPASALTGRSPAA